MNAEFPLIASCHNHSAKVASVGCFITFHFLLHNFFAFYSLHIQIKSYSSSMSNSEYYDAMDTNNQGEDRTSSDEESFSSEGEGEADSVNSENSEHSNKVGAWTMRVKQNL